MSARAAAYPVQGKNSTTCMTRTGQRRKPMKKLGKPAVKNTSNGTLAKNKVVKKVNEPFSLALTLSVLGINFQNSDAPVFRQC
jgi:hypothetical protein